jgi:hypothetical protein
VLPRTAAEIAVATKKRFMVTTVPKSKGGQNPPPCLTPCLTKFSANANQNSRVG